jgi:NAD(P)-dependent dehydrogenase (short-subunit alcohol dehydrogenase family)
VSAALRGSTVHLTTNVRPGGSFVLFSGVAAFKPAIGYLGVAATNGAVNYLVRSLALELAPLRVNAISPGVIDTGAWDGLGGRRQERVLRPQARADRI